MESGPSIDPRSLRPKTRNERAREQHEKHLEQLRAASSKVGITSSESARIVLGHIRSNMIARMTALAAEDDECKAYTKMLKALGDEESVAERALDEMFQVLKLKIVKPV